MRLRLIKEPFDDLTAFSSSASGRWSARSYLERLHGNSLPNTSNGILYVANSARN